MRTGRGSARSSGKAARDSPLLAPSRASWASVTRHSPNPSSDTHFKPPCLGVHSPQLKDPDGLTPRVPVPRWEDPPLPASARPLASHWVGDPPLLLLLMGLELLKEILSWDRTCPLC